MITGKNAAQLGCGGSFGNGYGIMIYPAAPNYISNVKMIVMPNKQYVDPWAGFVRQFTGWTTSHEISWNNNNPMMSCSAVTAFLGKFTVSITP